MRWPFWVALAINVVFVVALAWPSELPDRSRPSKRVSPTQVMGVLLGVGLVQMLIRQRRVALEIEADEAGLRWLTQYGPRSARLDQLRSIRPTIVRRDHRFELTDGRTFVVTAGKGFLPFTQALHELAPTVQIEVRPGLAQLEVRRFPGAGKFERW